MRRMANYFLVGIAVASAGWSNVARCMDPASQLPLEQAQREIRQEERQRRQQTPSRWSRLGESLARFRCSEETVERGLIRTGLICVAVGTTASMAFAYGDPKMFAGIATSAGAAMLWVAYKYADFRADVNANRATENAMRANASARDADKYAKRIDAYALHAAKSASLVDAMCDGVTISLEDAQLLAEEPETVQSKEQRRDRRTKDSSSSDQQFFEEEESSLDEVPLESRRK